MATISPNMLLPIPSVGLTSGPQYATDVDSCLNLIDQHDHSANSGVKVTPAGLNINANLTINDHLLTNVAAVNLYPQVSPPTIISLYAVENDLWFIDGAFNEVRITVDGGLAGTPGSISGLLAPAAASYSAGTFTFQSDAGGPTSANIDAASYVFRNNTAGSFGVTLQPRNSLSSDYTLTLPPLPGQTNVMTLSAIGTMDSITYDDVAAGMTTTGTTSIATTMSSTNSNTIYVKRTITVNTSPGLGGLALSNSSGNFITTSNNTDVTNLSVTLQTSGRPVQVEVISVGTSVSDGISLSNGGSVAIKRDGGVISYSSSTSQITFGSGGLSTIDFPGAGTYTYTFASANITTFSSSMNVTNMRLVAYEL